SRLNYLRGDRSNEQTPTSSTTYVGTFRTRASVLGDIIDSNPTWVGPPDASYPNSWADLYDGASDPTPENAGQSYGTFASTSGFLSRENVVYVGANDGLLHGFRSGYFSDATTYQPATNDGYEVLAYMPGYVSYDIQTTLPGSGPPPVYDSPLNYSDPQYGHRFDVDAPPGTGDLFYAGAWHTWLVGGLGPGGNAIYAIDVTDPTQFSEANAASLVIGEWSTSVGSVVNPGPPVTVTPVVNSTTLSCANDTGATGPCGNHLGKTYGIPQIRRFHNGSWGAVFGNGASSVGGDGGIYVMLVNPTFGPSNGGITFYYLSTSTGSQASPNGIYYVSSADLDGDNIVDYVYAGDLQGNIWRFDLTSSNPANWGVDNAAGNSVNSNGGTPTPLFSTASPTGVQPITSQVMVVAIANNYGNPRLLVEFGTGEQTPLSNSSGATFLTTQQALYGVWDWNVGTWNSKSASQYDGLPGNGVSAPSTPISGTANLQQQSITGTYAATVANTGSDYRTLSAIPICWADTTGCNQFGWYLNLVSGNAYSPDPAIPQNGNANYANTPVVYEQVIYNPSLEFGAFVVNTTIPAATASTTCFSAAASGWTMAIDPTTGGAFSVSSFVNPGTQTPINVTQSTTTGSGTTTSSYGISGEATGNTGSESGLLGGTAAYLIGQGPGGKGNLTAVSKHGLKGNRVTWIQRR
ncbi:MAG TPA: PilC/PilY family type IV pilus protein, partial [Steroidobacteraceae bacterium]|nr:PilC/PilY family type IV pilus protein [Steroidobacteraceae bacterium]